MSSADRDTQEGARSWWWLVRKVGPYRALRYWLLGQKRGWMTEAQAAEWFERNFGVRL